MEVSSKFVGMRTLPFTAEVTARHAMNFAVSVGDANPRYLDDEREGGIVAPPMIVAALTWPVSLDIGDYFEDKTFPAHFNKQQVHYTETIEWHGPIVPGQKLDITGSLVGLLNHPAGTHMVMRYDATDNGQPVFTEYTGALLRDVKLLDGSKGRDAYPKIEKAPKTDDIQWSERVDIDPLAAHIYDGCADICFPIHTSPAFAHSVGLPGIILHGSATLSMAVKEITNREADGDCGRLRTLDCMFTGMVIPGEHIVIRLLTKRDCDAGEECFFEVHNHEGKNAISRGRLVFDKG